MGVYSDEFLSFDSHISQLCKKISKTLLILNKIKNFVHVDALKKLSYALVHSSITYSINIKHMWIANKTTFKQKKAVRIISRAKYRYHTNPLFADLEILPLEELIAYHRLKCMHIPKAPSVFCTALAN